MREIKFRAWDKTAKRWVGKRQDMLLVGDDGVVTIEYRPHPRGTWEPCQPKQLTWAEVKNLEIMQYSGLKDRNGREIYEGDILNGKAFPWGINDEWVRGTAHYSQKSAAFIWIIMGHKDVDGFTLRSSNEYEVIGNIYENPELLRAA